MKKYPSWVLHDEKLGKSWLVLVYEASRPDVRLTGIRLAARRIRIQAVHILSSLIKGGPCAALDAHRKLVY
jgi:hypothetical protein